MIKIYISEEQFIQPINENELNLKYEKLTL